MKRAIVYVAWFLGCPFWAMSQSTVKSPHGNLKEACATCHVATDWQTSAGVGYDHAVTGFVLNGGHDDRECKDCHESMVFSEIGTTCQDCHTDVHQSRLGADCSSCHDIGSWDNRMNMWEAHSNTRFPLLGVHARVECEACHEGSFREDYNLTPTDCLSCHQDAYLATTAPNHAELGFSPNCELCHEPIHNQWEQAFFEHSAQFPLTLGHSGLDCSACHQDGYVATPTDCYACHDLDYTNTTDPNHQASAFPTDCMLCHTTAAWEPATFDHDQTAFPLTGAHTPLDCNACHEDGYTGTPTDCISCHETDFNGTTDPNHLTNNFSTDCTQCHTTTAWAPSSFDHNQTAFPLIGAHTPLDCIACHEDGYVGTPTDCIACHEVDFNGVDDPNHVTNNFSTDCTQCHTSSAWIPATFDHNQTAFSLTGAHTPLDCIACHEDGYVGTPTDCIACHDLDFNATTDPNHVTNNFSTDCTICHTTNAWEPSTFDHNQTAFPLIGAHTPLDCIACHEDGYAGTPTDCIACHEDDFNGVDDPNHVTNNFSTDCTQCHTSNAWEPTTFDHNQTAFPLIGAHTPLDCIACHEDGYAGTPTDCIACHEEDYNGVDDPNHVTNNFSTDCTQCHTSTAWEPSTFDHNQTAFSLTGAHTPLDCIACHEDGYAGTPTDCIACHDLEFNATTDPNHVTNNFSTDCTICHTTNAWEPSTFDHNQTAFPLIGAHSPLDCIACHEDGYAGTPTDCIACHEEDYNGVDDPNHVTNNFSTDCTQCHTSTAWEPTTFDHNQTAFSLTGAHTPLDCIACHEDGYAGTPTDCISCHDLDFNATTDPNHVTNNFSTDCTICHTTNAWEPSTFDHNQTAFPLIGAHTPLDCIACHEDGYTGTPTDCIACHEEDYNGVDDPNHVTNNFSTDCTLCHTSTAWEPATFDHNQTAFPLTGAHMPLDCIACHEDGYSGTPSDCIDCHQSDYNGVTDPNHVANNFSTDCTLCHTTNAWEPATFDHNQTAFPLRGAHLPLDCIACHELGYEGTPTDCIACHDLDYNNAEPNHVNAGFPTDCTLCHNEVAWEQTNWDHDGMYFPIYSGEHRNEWDQCTECHIGGVFTTFECIECHEHNRADMDEEHDGVSGYVYESQACFNCHPDGRE